MFNRFFIIAVCFLILAASAMADEGEPVDLLGGDADCNEQQETVFVLDAAWECADPFGEFDPCLGAGAALNRALGLIFSGHASPEQLELELSIASEHAGNGYRFAPFASDVLTELQENYQESFPEPVVLEPFSLAPSDHPVVSADDPNIVIVRYNEEEYLERLLQRLYFKLIQGPVLLTVAYQGNSPDVPEEYRNWDNFRYASNDNTMVWNDVRLVYVDWDLIQTVVLNYEDGKIACYDSGVKYYIDHTAAVASAGAVLAHPDLANMDPEIALNYVLVTFEDEQE